MSRPGDLARSAVPSLVNLAVVVAAFSAMPALSYPGGYTGRTATTSAGCGTCHKTGSGATNVVLSGPATLAPGAVGSYTCVVAHAAGSAPGTNAGVDIGVKTAPNGATDAGTLAATGTDLKTGVSPAPAELTQASAKRMSGTPVQASFAFTWTAPTTPGTYTMQALGLATSGTSNAAWSWATPLAITVAAVETSVDVLVPVVLDVLGGGTGRFTTAS